ncbi:DnaJ-class molecular chaperone [Streptomonospora nanhaiensis]|uniref:DnaJ-class molecular chaperone n=1 Tax=Streptomonospora nanhaiensis TaxID=1323731 RepID=A0A853BNA9_9ACTN|nr:DnaJ-class molecular chaperone [Streptomonospora nanhaiensis]
MAQCKMCNGTGVVFTTSDGDGKNPWKSTHPVPCPNCKGTGKV